MGLSSYPRVTVQGTGNANNVQNGFGLMVFNSTTGKYEAATASTFGGVGGGDATAANQTSQINLATTLNTYLYDSTSGYSAVTLLGFIAGLLNDINNNVQLGNADLGQIRNELIALNQATIDGTALTQIIGDGNIAFVDNTNKLQVKTGSI